MSKRAKMLSLFSVNRTTPKPAAKPAHPNGKFGGLFSVPGRHETPEQQKERQLEAKVAHLEYLLSLKEAETERTKQQIAIAENRQAATERGRKFGATGQSPNMCRAMGAIDLSHLSNSQSGLR